MLEGKSKPTVAKKREGFEATNLQSAWIITADPDRYGGEESLAVRWARMVLARLRGERSIAA